MELAIIIAAMMVFLCIKGIYDKKQSKIRLIARLKRNWGALPEEEYSEEKYRSLQYYYENQYKEKQNRGFCLDQITWNDLNMDELYFMLNATNSSMGEEYLWALLHELKLSGAELEKREEIIRFFQDHPEERLKIQTAFAFIGKNKRISIFEYLDRVDQVKRQSNLPHFAVLGLMITSVVLMLLNIPAGGILLIGCIVYNILTYYKRKGEISAYFSVISYLIRMIKYSEEIAKSNCSELEVYNRQLLEKAAALKKFRKGAPAVEPENPTGDPMELFFDYIKILFHTDLIRFNAMLDEYFDKKDLIIEIFETVGFLDAMCAIASFRTYLGTYCLPMFTEHGKRFHAEGLYHPFLSDPVPADIQTERSVLITGSNASGKSTFIKAAAMNAILAQTVHTVCARNYEASCFKVMTSMALTDNLFGNESYYIVEIKSLKRIFDETKDTIPVLCFVDEVLRGTNTVERIAASSRILYSIAEANAILFAATHDIELTYMLEHYFENYHFEEQILENNIFFDYKLKNGRATSQNAIALLGMLGYPQEIIDKARETAQHFLNEGEWRQVT